MSESPIASGSVLPVPTGEAFAGELDVLRERVRSLEEQMRVALEDLRTSDEMRMSYAQQAGQNRNLHIADIEAIGEALLIWTEENGREEEYDEFLKNINQGLTFPLVTRERDFTITETYTVTRSCSVRASSAEEAYDSVAVAYSVDALEYDEWCVDDISLSGYDVEEE